MKDFRNVIVSPEGDVFCQYDNGRFVAVFAKGSTQVTARFPVQGSLCWDIKTNGLVELTKLSITWLNPATGKMQDQQANADDLWRRHESFCCIGSHPREEYLVVITEGRVLAVDMITGEQIFGAKFPAFPAPSHRLKLQPTGMCVDPVSGCVWVANAFDGSIYVLA